jgi:hypothetical protein
MTGSMMFFYRQHLSLRAKIMRLALILTAAAFVAVASTAHTECLSSASAVWSAHPGSHAIWRLRLPGHEGTKCWYSASVRKVTNADASRDAAHEIRTVSATAIPIPRPRSQDAPADSERASLPAVGEPASAGEARSILMWGRPMRIDDTWEELFAGRERGITE